MQGYRVAVRKALKDKKIINNWEGWAEVHEEGKNNN